MTDNSVRLAVLTPCLTGQVHIEHSEAIASLRMACLSKGISMCRLYQKGSSVLCKARNLLTQRALDQGADWLLWVDDDIAFDSKDVFRLMEHEKDIIGGAAQKRTKLWGEQGSMMLDADLVVEDSGLIKARRLGTGFLLVRAEVFRRMADEGLADLYRTRDAVGDGMMHRWFWFGIDEDGFDVGEDYYFCNQAAALGYEMWCDPNVKLNHYGMINHPLSLSDIIKAQEAIE